MSAADASLPEDAARRIVAHMNADHAGAVLGYARHHGRRPDATAARLVGIDVRGLDLLIETAAGGEPLRVDFAAPLEGAEQARSVLVRMAEEARDGPAGSPDGPGRV